MSVRKIENTMDNLIVALCLDYDRRRRAIDGGTVKKRVETEFRYLNFKIHSAAAEIVGVRNAEIYIQEIGNRVGYALSRTENVSESTYKKYKHLVKMNIAHRLHLSD